MLTAEEKQLIDDAADALYCVSKDDTGTFCIDLYADYSDTNEGLLQLAYDNRLITRGPAGEHTDLQDILCDKISGYYDQTTWQMEDDIIKKAGFNPSSAKAGDIHEYFLDAYSFRVPYDHYLDQHMRVNLMLGTPEELNLDFGTIYEIKEALIGQMDSQDRAATLQEKTALRWLVEQQGYTMEDLQTTMEDYIQCFYGESGNNGLSHEAKLSIFHKTHSFFLSSVCEELENTTNFMNTLTMLADVSMRDYCAMIMPNQELVIPKGIILGVFNPWLGGGSTLDITLEKDLVLPSSMIWSVQVEGAQMESQYSVDSVYGLTSGAWKQGITIRDTKAFAKENTGLAATNHAAVSRREDSTGQKERPGTDAPER